MQIQNTNPPRRWAAVAVWGSFGIASIMPNNINSHYKCFFTNVSTRGVVQQSEVSATGFSPMWLWNLLFGNCLLASPRHALVKLNPKPYPLNPIPRRLKTT